MKLPPLLSQIGELLSRGRNCLLSSYYHLLLQRWLSKHSECMSDYFGIFHCMCGYQCSLHQAIFNREGPNGSLISQNLSPQERTGELVPHKKTVSAKNFNWESHGAHLQSHHVGWVDLLIVSGGGDSLTQRLPISDAVSLGIQGVKRQESQNGVQKNRSRSRSRSKTLPLKRGRIWKILRIFST